MNRRTRFFRWFRVLPLLAVVIVGALSLAVGVAPKSLLRKYVFPITYREAILDSSYRHGVDPRLVCAIITNESGWDASAYSAAGAAGLMQVMPSTAETLVGLGYVDGWSYDASNLLDPTTNIEYGVACIDFLDDNLGDTDQVIAAYNAGIGTVQEWMSSGSVSVSDVIAYPETRIYLVKVNETYKIYQKLYDENLNDK